MKNFNEIYKDIYVENRVILNKIRKKELFSRFAILIIGIIFTKILSNLEYHTLGILMATGTIIIALIYYYNSEYRKKFKRNVIKKIITELCPGAEYYPICEVDRNIYLNAGFEKDDIKYSKYEDNSLLYFEDVMRGTIDNKQNIMIFEAKVKKRIKKDPWVIIIDWLNDNRNRRHYHTVFHGLFCRIELSKNTNETIKISSRSLIKRVFASEKSTIFERYFKVETRKNSIINEILTSEMKNKLIRLKHRIKYNFDIKIKDNYLYIRVKNRRSLEENLFLDAVNYNVIKKHYDLLNFFFEIGRSFYKTDNDIVDNYITQGDKEEINYDINNDYNIEEKIRGYITEGNLSIILAFLPILLAILFGLSMKWNLNHGQSIGFMTSAINIITKLSLISIVISIVLAIKAAKKGEKKGIKVLGVLGVIFIIWSILAIKIGIDAIESCIRIG